MVGFDLWIPYRIAKYYLQHVHPSTVDTACMLIELIFIRDGSFWVNLPCFEDDVQFLISHLCFIFFLLLLYFMYEFIINII